MEAEQTGIDETLARLEADPEKAVMIPFPCLGWEVHMHSHGEPNQFHVNVYVNGELRVDEIHDGDKIRQLMAKTARTETRRVAALGALLALQTERFLADAAEAAGL